MPKQILIDEATPEQIRSYATDFLNLDVGDADARSAIERAEPGITRIFILDAQEPLTLTAADAAPPTGEGMIGSLGRGDPKWKIVIPIVESVDNSGKNDVLVGVNGRAWQIKRGVEVVLPHRVVIALQNAIADVVTHDESGDVEVRKAQRIGFQVVEQPAKAEIEAWEEATNAQFCA